MLNELPPSIIRGVLAAIRVGRYSLAVRIARAYVRDPNMARLAVAEIARNSFPR